MAQYQLINIQELVRNLTRSPSLSQLSNDQLNFWINNFIINRLANRVRLFPLRTTFTFYTQPGVDVYSTNTTDVNDALYNFKNKYIAIHPPIFMAGIPAFFTQWRDEFYALYPQTNTIAKTGLTGDGTSTGPFSGTIFAKPMLQNNVIFTCLDTSGAAMILVDYPVSNSQGALGLVNQPQSLPSPYGFINYITGEFTVIFPAITQAAAPITIENITYAGGRPITMLYYNDKFTLRPVPNDVYAIQMEADIVPTELLNSSDSPDISQWWQYIAYGAARDILALKQDYDSIQKQEEMFLQLESEVLRPTLTQQANERTETIYTVGKNYGYGWWFGGGWPY